MPAAGPASGAASQVPNGQPSKRLLPPSLRTDGGEPEYEHQRANKQFHEHATKRLHAFLGAHLDTSDDTVWRTLPPTDSDVGQQQSPLGAFAL